MESKTLSRSWTNATPYKPWKNCKNIRSKSIVPLDDLFDYITAEYSKESALEIRQRIKDAIRSLCHLPKRHRTFFKDFRRMTVGKYLILYVVKGQTVTVKAVFHSSMDIIFHLKDR